MPGDVKSVLRLQDKAQDMLKRRTKELMNGGPRPPTMDLKPVVEEADGTFGVSSDRHNVILSLGDAPAFKVTKETAIQLGMLILKHAGVKVEVD